MGWVRTRETSDGTYSTEAKAEKAWEKAENDLAAGRIGDPRRGRQQFRAYVTEIWFPKHSMELATRQNYHCLIGKHLMLEFGGMRMVDFLPEHVREWLATMAAGRVPAQTRRHAKAVLDAILTTAFNDQGDPSSCGQGSEAPDGGQEDQADPHRPDGKRFHVKEYPKDGEWRQLKVARHLTDKLVDFANARALGPDDLFFEFAPPTEAKRRKRPEQLPDPITLGSTEPHPKSGRQYRHGTITAYSGMKCRCQYCRDAMSAYRAERRAMGMDEPRKPRVPDTDGHIDGNWFRNQVFYPAVTAAGIVFKVTPKSMRDAHASWLLAGGADPQIVKERLGHGSITTTEQYLGTLPGAGDAALSALDAIRGARTAVDAQDEPSTVKDGNPDMAELMKMMATIKDTYERLAS